MRPEAGPRGKRGVGSDHGQTGAGTVYVIARALCAGCSPHQHPPVAQRFSRFSIGSQMWEIDYNRTSAASLDAAILACVNRCSRD
jgi:hypothetical protein